MARSNVGRYSKKTLRRKKTRKIMRNRKNSKKTLRKNSLRRKNTRKTMRNRKNYKKTLRGGAFFGRDKKLRSAFLAREGAREDLIDSHKATERFEELYTKMTGGTNLDEGETEEMLELQGNLSNEETDRIMRNVTANTPDMSSLREEAIELIHLADPNDADDLAVLEKKFSVEEWREMNAEADEQLGGGGKRRKKIKKKKRKTRKQRK